MRIYVPIRPSRNRMLDDEVEDEFNKEFMMNLKIGKLMIGIYELFLNRY